MSTEADKAIAACVAYAKAQADVRRLTNAIGEALDACRLIHAAKHPDEWTAPEWESHLSQAYAPDHESDYGPDYMEPDEQEAFLAEKCPHCLAAHQAIQQRKVARKAFGAAKRFVGGIGRRASSTNPNKEAPTP
jgi:hypothetical protein